LLGDTDGPKPWKTAIGLNGFASSSRKYGKEYPITEVLAFAKDTGFQGVELVQRWPDADYPTASDTTRIKQIRDLYSEYELHVFSIQTGAAGAFDPDEAKRQRWLKQFREHARFANAVGADCIGMWPGGGLRGQSIEAAIRNLARSFDAAATIAEDLNLIAAFEIEPPFVFNTEGHLRQILQQADNPVLKTIYDPSHFDLMSGSQGHPHEMLERIGVENIGYVHLTDTDGTLRDGGTSKHLACGDGHVDISKSLDALIQGGFGGWVMIDAWEIPDVYNACVKGKRAIHAAIARAQDSKSP
jgi:sugar phosphate isomerase/epimerase